MCGYNEMAQEWVLRKLIFHWLCKPCHCHLFTSGEPCVRCSELPEMKDAFPAHYLFAHNAFEKLQAEKAAKHGV
jgi:hypothetical protein